MHIQSTKFLVKFTWNESPLHQADPVARARELKLNPRKGGSLTVELGCYCALEFLLQTYCHFTKHPTWYPGPSFSWKRALIEPTPEPDEERPSSGNFHIALLLSWTQVPWGEKYHCCSKEPEIPLAPTSWKWLLHPQVRPRIDSDNWAMSYFEIILLCVCMAHCLHWTHVKALEAKGESPGLLTAHKCFD